jgi:hypothetical protein
VLSFGTTGGAPTNAPVDKLEELKNTNHLASRKFFIVLTSFVALCFFYFISVGILFVLPQQNDLISGYVTIFTKTIEVLAIIIASYLGVQAVVDLKYNSNSQTTHQPSPSSEKKIVEETTKYQNIYTNDSSYAPVAWAMSYEETKR